MIAFASSLDQAGTITVTAEDAALLMNVIAGFDERDSTSVDVDVPDYTATLDADINGLKIGVPKEFFDEGLDDRMAQAVREALKVYEAMGATIVDVSLPNLSLSVRGGLLT
jgi:aspartyl-tRNA(Asn)/glutamyl-tRNA(Gln) amidotransferase subunit A